MRFGLRISRSTAIGDEFLPIQSDFLQKGYEAARGGGGHEQPTTDLPFDLVDGQGAVDLVILIRIRNNINNPVPGGNAFRIKGIKGAGVK